MTHIVGATVESYFECREASVESLVEMAKRIDATVGADPPPGGYDLGKAISAIFNGGTTESIQAAMSVLAGWNFRPQGGWVPE